MIPDSYLLPALVTSKVTKEAAPSSAFKGFPSLPIEIEGKPSSLIPCQGRTAD